MVVDRAIDHLSRIHAKPFFLSVHLMDVHHPYIPPHPYQDAFRSPGAAETTPERLWAKSWSSFNDLPENPNALTRADLLRIVDLYDGSIRYVDDQIGRLVDALGGHGVLDDTLIVVTADHGESLTEHGFFFAHGWRLFEPSMRVPLVIRYPGGLPAGLRVDAIAQSIDVLPTLLELLGIDVPAEIDGISLLPVIDGREQTLNPYALAKTTKSLTYLEIRSEREILDQYALRTPEWKYIAQEDGRRDALFDLVRDPLELRDVGPEQPGQADLMRRLLADALRDGGRTERLEAYGLERVAEWRALLGLAGHVTPTSAADPWIRSRADRVLGCLPASGKPLKAALAQLGLEWTAL